MSLIEAQRANIQSLHWYRVGIIATENRWPAELVEQGSGFGIRDPQWPNATSRLYREGLFENAPLKNHCLLQIPLFSFGYDVDPLLRKEVFTMETQVSQKIP